jgi:hypothetical protein
MYLRNLKKLLGNFNNSAQLLDVVNALLDRVGMIGTCSIENVLVLLNLAFSPLPIHRAAVLGHACENAEKAECHNRLFIYHVEFIANRCDGKTSCGGNYRSLRNERAARNGIKD